MTEEWGPWIEHDGKGCPVLGQYGEYYWNDGDSFEGVIGKGGISRLGNPVASYTGGGSWEWKRGFRVVRYRVRRPKALQQLIQMVENLPAPSRQYEDA